MLGLLVCAGIGASVAAAAYDGSATGIIATASSAAPTATATPTVTPPTPTVTGRRRRGQSSFPMFSMTVGSEISVNACGPDGCAHWVEATSWEGASYPSLFLGTDFDLATGRFNVRRTGLYFASSMLRIDGASSGWYSTAILTNGVQSWDSGMSALNGALSSNYHDFTMAGTRWLDEGDFLSVWAYAHNDASFVLQQNSAGFHAYLISEQPSTVAFSATKDGAQHVVAGDANSCGWDPTAVPGCGWAEVTGGSAWKVDGYKGLLANDAFDLGTGRFTAPRAGIYLACTTIRLDSADEGWFSTAILTNGADSFDGSFDSGMSVLSGGLSENYNDMTISGLRQLESGDFLSVAVYSAFDTDYTMYSNSAGFSAASIRSKVAFSAAKVETQDVTTAGWTESSGPYSCTGYKGLFPHARFDETTGRFTAPSAGIYFTSANIRLDHADTGWFSAAVLTNGEPSWESGMSALNGNLAANFEDMCVVGLRLLQADDFVSVWVYSNEDVEYSIAHDGGSLHVAQLRRMRDGDDVPAESFSVTVADASGNSGDSGTLGSTGWTEMSSWESESYKGLAHDFDFDTSTGRFTAQHSGIYYVAAQVRLDGADAGWFSVAILTNSEPSWESGLSALTGDAADNYHDISVVGLRDLAAQEYVSVWVYASQDTMYTLYSNSAGFHGCLLNTNVGFSATKGGDLSVDHTEWQEVVAAADDFAWSTSDYPSLFEISLPNTAASLDLSTGRFTVPEDGIYFASAMVRLDHADEGWFTAAVFTNGVASWHSGMSVAGEPADDYSDMTVSGFRQLQANDFLSVWVYSQIDESYLIQANSGGFSACVIDTGVAFSAARNENIHVQANGWTEMTGGGYTTDGYKGLFKLDNSFEEATGRFTAPSAGIYLASANIRLDNADEGWFSAAILTNGEASWESGMSVLNGDLADLYDNLAVSGLRQLDRGDWLSLWAYSNTDSDFDSDWAGFHVALVSDGLSTAGGTTDSDVVSGARIWQETWGVPTGHDGNDAGYNHLGSDAWGVCGQTRADRIQCCADECVRLGDACAAFAIWAPTSTDPPCCCHYISAADAATPIVANPTAQGPGDGWATWMPVQSHLHDTLHDLTTIEECTMETFTERADQMNAACCADGNACGDMGMPDRCTLDCATAFVPFMEECRPLIVALVADELPAFEGLKTSCLAIDPSTMWSAVTNLDAQGCLLREHAAPPLPPSTGGGHRRTQGLNFHHDLGNENCPMDSFNQRVQSIDVACCTQDGRDVCAADGVPTSCNLPCAVKFRIFYADCQSLVTTLLGDEVGEFESLSAQCTQQDPREMIYSLARPEGCVDAASCAQMGITDTSDVSMFYNGRGFTTHCLAAADVGTTGAAFTRFWHYDGRLSGGFPAGAEDVLGEAYGSCEDLNACFQRLPTFVPEQGAEFLVTDGTSTMLFDFDDSCDVAHAAFQAFHDGVEARIVGGACNWTPKAIQGSAPPTDGDSFFYGDSWGVKSLLLDDDGCYCASLLEAGKISCWSAGQAQNTWGDSPQGATIPAGVDFIAPADGCSYVDPAAGPLSFYFREPATSSGDGGYDACDPDSVTQIVVSGAGAAEWDGVYLRAANVGDGAAFQKDATHEIYSSGGVWRLADYGVATFCELFSPLVFLLIPLSHTALSPLSPC
jgi:hypothetical protein